jgi:hypothetical protein
MTTPDIFKITNAFEAKYLIALVQTNNGIRYLAKQKRRHYSGKRTTYIEWSLKRQISNAAQFDTLKMAEHRARTNPKVKEFLKAGHIWEIVKIYIPVEPPKPKVVSSSRTDTPLHRLAKVAK